MATADGANASGMAARAQQWGQAWYGYQLSEARKLAASRPDEATTLYLALYLAAPGTLDRATVDEIASHVRSRYGLGDVAVLSM